MAQTRTGRWGELNGFVGLALDNLAVVLLLVLVLCSSHGGFFLSFVIGRMIPGTAAGVLLAGLVMAVLAWRTGRKDATAVPVGLDTPTAVAIATLVLLPILHTKLEATQDHTLASFYAWHVGAVCVVFLGLIKLILAPFGEQLRSILPRAALLGALAALTVPLLVFLPMIREIGASPIVGLPVLALVLFAFPGTRKIGLDRTPLALIAVAAGLVIYVGVFGLGTFLGIPLAQPLASRPLPNTGEMLPWLPEQAYQWAWWQDVLTTALTKLPLLVPFALNTVVGALECVESAKAEGDEYGTGWVLSAEAISTLLAGLLGGVVQTTPYYGHPAYKTLQAGKWYPALTGLFLVLLSATGAATYFYSVIPPVVIFPVVVFIGLHTVARSLEAIPVRHFAAVALAGVPTLAYLSLILLSLTHGGPPREEATGLVVTLRTLASGFVLTSLLWAAVLATLLDGERLRSAGFLLVLAVFSGLGLIHATSPDETLAWPPAAYERLRAEAESVPHRTAAARPEPHPLEALASQIARDFLGHVPPPSVVGLTEEEHARTAQVRLARESLAQTPYHWAVGYVLMALVILMGPLLFGQPKPPEPEKPETSPSLT
jgi:AGZA family xanthine/uracil permease-like MFS transporter